MTRRIISLNRSWLYSPTLSPACTAQEFDDSTFAQVIIPHANRRLPWHSFDDADYQFVSVYRRHLRVPEAFRGQRLFVDFGGVMTAAKVTFNGHLLGEYLGGYTPFSFEVTDNLIWDGDNVLVVEVDSTERADIPPFGGQIDYLTFGGIYRDVSLRIVAPTFIGNVFARPEDVLTPHPRVAVQCLLETSATLNDSLRVEATLLDGDSIMARADVAVQSAEKKVELTLTDFGTVELWDINKPKLYAVQVRLVDNGATADEYTVRIGFRDARFTPDGFYLNGQHLKLRGLNRHQTYPFVGQAMPARVQRRDAEILKHELKCNLVRTSHYPQSPHFLDCCDEIGLLVFEEIPGWQHIGDEGWKDIAVRNVGEMIRRDWNHPSIIIWGVRINESPDDHDFYVRTNAAAHALDPSRQTGGVRNFFSSERLEDVFTINDFDYPAIAPPNHPLYLNTEFIGHTFSTKPFDNVDRVQEHAFRHARIHHLLGTSNAYAGGIGWCAFDYNTHNDFGSGDRICWHGVSDIFRIPKPTAAVYRSQCDPAEEVVLEPSFAWAMGDRSGAAGPGTGMICSNCDALKIYIGGALIDEIEPDRERFGGLPHPPFFCDKFEVLWNRWDNLRIDGYLGGELVASRQMSSRGVDRAFHAVADDAMLIGDGSDATRVVFRVTDEYGAIRPFATGAIQFELDGPGEIVGDNPFALVGGVGAIWVKSQESSGTIRLRAIHPVLGSRQIEIEVGAALEDLDLAII